MDQLKELLEKIPASAIAFAVLLYFGYDFWSFTNDPNSELNLKKSEITRLQQEKAKVGIDVKKAREFFQGFEQRKERIRGLATKLSEMKGTLSEEVDIPKLLKLVATEGRKVGLEVRSIRPAKDKKWKYYTESTFDLEYEGLYYQLLVFLERLSKVRSITRVDDFSVEPKGKQDQELVQIKGRMRVSVFRYSASPEDELSRQVQNGS